MDKQKLDRMQHLLEVAESGVLTDDEKNELFSLRRECARSHYPETVQTKQDEDIGREC